MEKIKFKHLKKIPESGGDFFINYLNSFSGNNVFEKFRSILCLWERDVSYDIGFNINGKDIKIQLFYIIKELESFNQDPLVVQSDNMVAYMDVPDKFYKNHDIFTVGNFIKRIGYMDLDIDFATLNDNDKNQILKSFPASIYNRFIQTVLKTDMKTVSLNNPSLNNMTINFMSDAPYRILKGLFEPYTVDYYRDIIYHLSKQIDGNILMNSTMKDIEYYVQKSNQDQKTGNALDLY
jgi:hypothetical protein